MDTEKKKRARLFTLCYTAKAQALAPDSKTYPIDCEAQGVLWPDDTVTLWHKQDEIYRGDRKPASWRTIGLQNFYLLLHTYQPYGGVVTFEDGERVWSHHEDTPV